MGIDKSLENYVRVRRSAEFREGQGAWAQGPPPKGGPTVFICFTICATCACPLVLFMEESLFVGVSNYNRSDRPQYSLKNIVLFCDETNTYCFPDMWSGI